MGLLEWQKADEENPRQASQKLKRISHQVDHAQIVDIQETRKENDYMLVLKFDQQEPIRDFARSTLVESTKVKFQRAWNKNKTED